MTLRRDFLKRLAIGVGGLLVADDALELITEPRRKIWPGHSFSAFSAPAVQQGYAFEVRDSSHALVWSGRFQTNGAAEVPGYALAAGGIYTITGIYDPA